MLSSAHPSKPASNSPFLEEMTRTPTSACAAPPDHVWHIVLVARRIEDSDTLGIGGKMRHANFHCLSLCTLLLVCIHDEGHEPTVVVSLLCLPLKLFDRAFIDLAGEEDTDPEIVFLQHRHGRERHLDAPFRLEEVLWTYALI